MLNTTTTIKFVAFSFFCPFIVSVSVGVFFSFSVEQYDADIQRHNRANCEGVYTIPTGAHIRDDEQV
jgi:hypothetical protein